jgi:hypothetical protein
VKPLVVAALLIVAVPSAYGRRATRACTARDLRASVGMLQGATGTMDGAVRFRNRSASACAVGGRPRVAVTTTARTVLPTRERAFASGGAVSTLAPRATAELRLDWANWCGAWSRSGGAFRTVLLRVRLTTGATVWARVRTGRPRCDQPSAPSTLAVSRFVATP